MWRALSLQMGSNFRKHLSNPAAACRSTLITHDMIVIIAEPCVELTAEFIEFKHQRERREAERKNVCDSSYDFSLTRRRSEPTRFDADVHETLSICPETHR